MLVLGLTGGFHPGSCDAAAALMRSGQLLAMVEEERLTRVKNSFGIPPMRCIKACLDAAGTTLDQVDKVVLYVESYPDAVEEMREHLEAVFGVCPAIAVANHHATHAASAYYASGFDDAAVVTFDWSGDGTSTSIWHGRRGQMRLIESIPRPNSLGVFYAAFTQFLGFERGDEYKVMGLAAYGQPNLKLDEFLDVSGEVYAVNPALLHPGRRSMYQTVYSDLLRTWRPDLRRAKWAPVQAPHKDLAASVQMYFEKAVAGLVARAKRLTGSPRLCIAGGGGLNCKCNGGLAASRVFEEIFVPPFPNDTGCAFGGAAVETVRQGLAVGPIRTAQWGPAFSDEQIEQDLRTLKCKARRASDPADYAASAVTAGKLVGWFQGPLEVGPRALGGRSILADPRDKNVRGRINQYVKFREDFRPFAPSVLEEVAGEYFEFGQTSPFMNFTARVRVPGELPGITHVDGTARLHTVANDGSAFSRLLEAMRARSGFACVLNTSFNYMGQPIVCTPKEAVYTFFGTGLDTLVLGSYVIEKGIGV